MNQSAGVKLNWKTSSIKAFTVFSLRLRVCVAESLHGLSCCVTYQMKFPSSCANIWCHTLVVECENRCCLQPPPKNLKGIMLRSGLFYTNLLDSGGLSVCRQMIIIIYVNYDYCVDNLMSGSCHEAEFRLLAPVKWDQMLGMVSVASRWRCWLCCWFLVVEPQRRLLVTELFPLFSVLLFSKFMIVFPFCGILQGKTLKVPKRNGSILKYWFLFQNKSISTNKKRKKLGMGGFPCK